MNEVLLTKQILQREYSAKNTDTNKPFVIAYQININATIAKSCTQKAEDLIVVK